MRSSRWCAGFFAAVGLAGSLVMGTSASPAAAAVAQPARPGAFGQLQSDPEGWSAGLSARTTDGYDEPGRPRVCRGLVSDPFPYVYRASFFCGDWRLGPKRLPSTGVLGHILEGYDRLGDLSAVQFLNTWWDPTAASGQGDWKYPPFDGFAVGAHGPIAAPLVLHAGQNLMLDRFGGETGRFLSPAGTAFGKRAIPPSNLDTSDPRYPYNYHVYRVAKDVTVCAGPAAPAFEQPGGAIQYATSSLQVCPTIPYTNVAALVGNGTLVQVNIWTHKSAAPKEEVPAT